MINVVTDSTCDIAPALATQLGITVVPMLVNIDGTTYEDGVTITREMFYRNLPTYKDIPKTAANSPGVLADAYRACAAAGANQIISVHIARAVSGVCNAADIAAADVKEEGIDVRVIDSKSMTMGLGWQAITAAQLATQGMPLDAVVAHLEHMRNNVRVVAMADTLKYLRKGGRVSALNATVGELLQVRLMIELKDGVISMFDRVRTRGRGIERVVDEVRKTPQLIGALKHITLVQTSPGQEKDLEYIRSKITDLGAVDAEPILVTPIIGAHFGPLGLGVIMVGE